MKITRLAELFAIKYKIAASTADLEVPLRKQIDTLWRYPNKLFNILKACAESEPSKGQESLDNKAYAGYKFCKQVVDIINHLKEKQSTISLGELRDNLLRLVKLIESQRDVKFSPKGNPSIHGESSDIQFPHVSSLIFQLFPTARRHDRATRDAQMGKARTGLSRILNLSLQMLESLGEIEALSPDKLEYSGKQDVDQPLPEKMVPQRTQLSNYDITDFIRQYGSSYGINSREDWDAVINSDPNLKDELTSVINALNRGHVALNDWVVRDEIAKALRAHNEAQQATTPHFEGK